MDCVLIASGSKGNCIYVGNDTDAVVIDAGIGYIQRTISEVGLPANNVRALLLTHEHSDHVRSAKAYLRAAKIPVAGSGGTISATAAAGLIPAGTRQILMREYESLPLNSLTVHSFRTYHDAAEPTGFVVDDGDARIGICLDTHQVSPAMLEELATCDAVVLESNYSEPAMKTDTFEACRECRNCGAACGGFCPVRRLYPRYLKDRIIQDGHLSNESSSAAVSALKDAVGTFALAHLSENYNRPNIARTHAEDAVRESGAQIFVSDQHPMYREKRMVRFSI